MRRRCSSPGPNSLLQDVQLSLSLFLALARVVAEAGKIIILQQIVLNFTRVRLCA